MYGYVECIRDDFSWLTKGNIYKVEYEGSDFIKVKNNLGDLKTYPSGIFRKLPKIEEDYLNTYEVKKEQTKKQLNEKYGFKFDKVDNKTKPTYYGIGFDVIDFCQMNNLDFMQGNVIKYVTRYKEKNGKEDLLKAKEYIDRMIEEME